MLKISQKGPKTPKKINHEIKTKRYTENAFYHTWDYLPLCANNGIVINKVEFQLCGYKLLIQGLKIRPTEIKQSKNILSAIQNFPESAQNITDAHSSFRQVNQVVWAFSVTPIMQSFHEVVKPNTKFH